jgi:site-specific recombinase XerD
MWESVTRLIPGVHAHMLRHSYATSLYRAGVDLKTAQYLLGHSDIRMTAEVYTHIAEQDVAKSTSRISEYFGKRDKNEESKKISEV